MSAALRTVAAPGHLRLIPEDKALRRVPRIRRLVPSSASAGDNLFIEGDNLGGADLRAEFGSSCTWAMSVDDRTAFCIVPHPALGPVTVSRFGLRSNAVTFGGGWEDDPTRVLRVDPADGLAGVFRDTPVIVRLSRSADVASVSTSTFYIQDADGLVPGTARLSPDGCVVIWTGGRLLEPAVEHVLTVSGVLDFRGREVTPYRSRFVPCTLVRAEISD